VAQAPRECSPTTPFGTNTGTSSTCRPTANNFCGIHLSGVQRKAATVGDHRSLNMYSVTPDRDGFRRCFVLMPFSVRDQDLPTYGDRNHWTEVYEGLIRPAVERCDGLICERDDIDVGSRAIVESIVTKIENAHLIVCDVSSFNPNVLFELGWTLRADRPYVLIKDDSTDFPFDLAQQYACTYEHRLQPIGLQKDVEALSRALTATLSDPERRYSFVRHVELSLRAVAAASAGNVEANLLLDIRKTLESFGARDTSTVDAIESKLTSSLSRANSILSATAQVLSTAASDDRAELAMQLHSQSILMGTLAQEAVQFTVVDANGVIVYHDRSSLIGRALLTNSHAPEAFSEVLSHRYGASAWIDVNRNVPTLSGHKRLNVAVFATVPDRGWKIIVEVHLGLPS
jgi:hypothetical protein